MAYEKHNYQSGAVLMASELNEMDDAIEALDQETTQLKDDLKAGTKATAVYHLGLYIDEDGDICQVDDDEEA